MDKLFTISKQVDICFNSTSILDNLNAVTFFNVCHKYPVERSPC